MNQSTPMQTDRLAPARRSRSMRPRRPDRASPRVKADLVRASALVSIARGLVGLLVPRLFARLAGARPDATRTRLLFGSREVMIGVGLLAATRTRPLVQARLAGDLVDVVLHLREIHAAPRSRRTRAGLALAVVLVATVVDAWLLDDT